MMAEVDATAAEKRPVDAEESPVDVDGGAGEEDVEARKLMGSRRLREAKDKIVKKARDKERLLGSRRLRTVRFPSLVLVKAPWRCSSSSHLRARQFGESRLSLTPKLTDLYRKTDLSTWKKSVNACEAELEGAGLAMTHGPRLCLTPGIQPRVG